MTTFTAKAPVCPRVSLLLFIDSDGNTLSSETGSIIPLSNVSRADTGHAIFHSNSSAGIACASCQTQALSGWLNEAPADPDAVTRGQTLFQSAEVGCAGCHAGTKLTDNATIDVGTGGAFQVPSLRGVKFRAPYIHSGCAATLADRFGTCGGANHGQTSQLTDAQTQDLIAYLETL